MLRRITAALFAAAILITGCTTTHTTAAARCPSPARQGTTYSSYTTKGTMPSGTTVRLSDGDLWTCANGHVSIH